jgi:hypothetical protein
MREMLLGTNIIKHCTILDMILCTSRQAIYLPVGSSALSSCSRRLAADIELLLLWLLSPH